MTLLAIYNRHNVKIECLVIDYPG